jgi:ribonucleotide monophosphatase NagD (HAD superfamily)
MPQSSLRAVILDLSGTLHIGDEPTRDAVAALARLRGAVPVRACSNTTKESRARLGMLLELGRPVRQELLLCRDWPGWG